MKKEWWYVFALVIVILVIMVVFGEEAGFAPREAGEKVIILQSIGFSIPETYSPQEQRSMARVTDFLRYVQRERHFR